MSSSDIEPHSFTKNFNFSSFKCEKQRFEEYLCNDAESDERSNIGRVFLFVHKRTKKLVGYVTLAMNHLPRDKHVRLENMTGHGTIPGLLLGQMARDSRYKRMGIGKIMLDWVIDHAIECSKRVGCRLIIVSSDEDKVKWYRDNGFVLVNGSKNKMFFDLLIPQS